MISIILDFLKRLFIVDDHTPRSTSGYRKAIKIGSQVLNFKLDHLDGRRLRSQHRDEFSCNLWYAKMRNEIFVYGKGDNTESTLPHGIIPKHLSSMILPFIDDSNEYVSYKALFNKDTGILTLELNVQSIEEVESKNRQQELTEKERNDRLQAEHVKRIHRDYKLAADFELTYEITYVNHLFRRKRKVDNVYIQFYDKLKYLDRHFHTGKLFVDGKYLGEIEIDHRVIRTYFSGYELCVKSCSVSREGNWAYIHPVIGLKN